MPSLSVLRSRVAALPGTARLVEALAVPSAEVVAAAPPEHAPSSSPPWPPTPSGAPVLVVTATGRDADELAAALRCYLPAGDVALLPSWETLPHERLCPRSDTVGRRLAVLRRLAHPETGDDTPRPGPGAGRAGAGAAAAGRRRARRPGAGARSAPATASTSTTSPRPLVAAAYTRVDMVEKRGEFAVRGGILDVFPPTEDHPLRVEFWGDDVEEIRWFSVADQRSLEIAEHGVWAPPCREILLTDAVRARAASARRQLPGAADMLDKLAAGHRRRGHGVARARAGRRHGARCSTWCPTTRVLVLVDPERVRAPGARPGRHQRRSSSTPPGRTPRPARRRPLDLPRRSATASFANALRRRCAERAVATCGVRSARRSTTLRRRRRGDTASTLAPARSPDDLPRRHRDDGASSDAATRLRRRRRAGRSSLVATEGTGPAQRMVEQLGERRRPRRLVGRLADEPERGVVTVDHRRRRPRLRRRAGCSLAVFTESDLTGRAGARTARHAPDAAAGAATSSTRCSCARATTWCTSSTASAGSSS